MAWQAVAVVTIHAITKEFSLVAHGYSPQLGKTPGMKKAAVISDCGF
jgi:hypothetical protein